MILIRVIKIFNDENKHHLLTRKLLNTAREHRQRPYFLKLAKDLQRKFLVNPISDVKITDMILMNVR